MTATAADATVRGPGRLGGSLVVAALVVLVDQLTKQWALSTLDDRDIDLVWTLRLNLHFNRGMAFSRGEDLGPVIGVLAILVVVGLLLSIKRQPGRLASISVGLVIGGALGNVVDRLFRDEGWFRGAVIDFIDLQWWPIFNVADMAIVIGGALLVIGSLRHPDRATTDSTGTTDATTSDGSS